MSLAGENIQTTPRPHAAPQVAFAPVALSTETTASSGFRLGPFPSQRSRTRGEEREPPPPSIPRRPSAPGPSPGPRSRAVYLRGSQAVFAHVRGRLLCGPHASLPRHRAAARPRPRRSPVCFPSCQQTRPGHAGPRRARLSPNGRLPPVVVSKTDAHKYSTPARASRNASVECGRQSRPATWKPRGPLPRGGPLGGLCRSSPHESDGTSSALYSAAKRGLESGGEDSAC